MRIQLISMKGKNEVGNLVFFFLFLFSLLMNMTTHGHREENAVQTKLTHVQINAAISVAQLFCRLGEGLRGRVCGLFHTFSLGIPPISLNIFQHHYFHLILDLNIPHFSAACPFSLFLSDFFAFFFSLPFWFFFIGYKLGNFAPTRSFPLCSGWVFPASERWWDRDRTRF